MKYDRKAFFIRFTALFFRLLIWVILNFEIFFSHCELSLLIQGFLTWGLSVVVMGHNHLSLLILLT